MAGMRSVSGHTEIERQSAQEIKEKLVDTGSHSQ